MMSSGINLVMTVIGFAVSTMFIVFICTRLICARIQLHASRRSFPMGSRSDFSILERGLHGLEPVMLANFPTKKYSDEFFTSADNSQCAVCLADYHKEDTLRILPSCGHYFHATCIDIWLYQHLTCPVCRISLREFTKKERTMRPISSSAAQYRYEGPFATNSYHYTMTGHVISPRHHDNSMTNPNHEDNFTHQIGGLERASHQFSPCPVHGEARENLCPVHDCYQITIDRENSCPVHGCNQIAVDHENFCPVHGSNQMKKDPANKHRESPSNS